MAMPDHSLILIDSYESHDAYDPFHANDSTHWSRRASWISGSESIYALLAKFAALNALSNRDLCELFVFKEVGRAGRSIFPKVDLRQSSSIRTGRLGNLFGIDAAAMQSAFVNDLFPNSKPLSSITLVWCSACAHRGYHSPAFQLNFYRTCPVHREELRRVCPRCKATIPYVLHASQSEPLFTCLHCRFDLAPELRQPRHALVLDAQAQAAHRDHIELVRFADTLPTLFNACRSALGRPNLPILMSKADVFRSCGAFRQFVVDVLNAVSARSMPPQIAVLPPTGIFSSLFESPPRTNDQTRTGDLGLEEAKNLYRCIRRNVFTRYCRGHRACIHAAMKTLWWDTEGTRIDSFCPVATAFLRWRMQWEGGRVPCQLDRGRSAPSREFLGLVSWLACEAPIGSSLWTHQLDAWLQLHLLACDCLDSFGEWHLLSLREKKASTWSKGIANAFRKRHWACSGRGTIDEPAMLFIEHSFMPVCAVMPASGAHVRSTRSALSRIQH